MGASALGGISWGIRFIAYIPLFVAIFTNFPDWKTIQHHPELHHAPYDTNASLATRAAGIGAILGTIWAFITWIPSLEAHGASAAIIGAVDAVITALFFIQVILAPAYVPLGRCKSHNMTTWGVPPGYKSFYLIVSNQTIVNSTIGKGDPNNWVVGAEKASYEACKEYCTIWGLSFVLFLMFGLAAACNACLVFKQNWNIRPYFAWITKLLSKIHWPWWHSYPGKLFPFLLMLVLDLVLLPPTILLAFTPSFVHKGLWRCIRWTGRLSLGLLQLVRWRGEKKSSDGARPSPRTDNEKNVELKTFSKSQLSRWIKEKKTPDGAKSTKEQELNTLTRFWRAKTMSFPVADKTAAPHTPTPEDRFAEFLIFDVLMLISRDLHFQDMMSLSKVSRRIREQVFPAGMGGKECYQLYKLYTCNPRTRQPCFSCNAQVCADFGCSGGDRTMFEQSKWAKLGMVKHIDAPNACKPHCGACWNRLTNTTSVMRKRCFCTPGTTLVKTCHRCRDLGEAEFYKRVERRVERSYAQQTFNNVLCGGGCGKVIDGVGYRWQVCTTCSRECRWHSHQAFSFERKQKPRDVEDGVIPLEST